MEMALFTKWINALPNPSPQLEIGSQPASQPAPTNYGTSCLRAVGGPLVDKKGGRKKFRLHKTYFKIFLTT
jgi:hypothetical protein